MEERNSQKLLRFLLSLWQQPEGSVTHLCFVGDIFDLWISDHKVFVERWNPIIKAIASLVKKHRTQLVYIEGNHDVHIGPFWEKKMGATVLTEPLSLLFGPWVIHLAHGDLINQNDKAYLSYRARIRSSFIQFLAHNLPGSFWDWLGRKMSAASAKHSRIERQDQQNYFKVLIREYAKAVAIRDRCHFVITGHFHVRDEYLFPVDDLIVKSVNLGTWVDMSTVPVYKIDEFGGTFLEL
jgi:UDP-2,3-diacylglucosamine hydrolase